MSRGIEPRTAFAGERARQSSKSHRDSAENAAEFTWQHDDVFGRIASRYDLLCDVFSLGIHRLWKRRVAKRIASEPWSVLLDGATGTGDIILRVLAHEATEGRTVIAADISEKMLAIARRRLGSRSTPVVLRHLDAEAMPTLADASVDAYSMSLVMKICDRRRALGEAFRILRPGGRLVILEASNIRWSLLHRAYLAYMATCMPVLGWLATGGDASAYRYLLQGIREFPSAEAFAEELRTHGFEGVAFERCSWGSSRSIRRTSRLRVVRKWSSHFSTEGASCLICDLVRRR